MFFDATPSMDSINKLRDTLITVYDKYGVKQNEFKSRMANYAFVKFSNRGDKIASFSQNGSVQIHSIRGPLSIFNQREDCKTHGGCSILEFHYSHDDAQIISITSDGLIRIWDSTANLTNSFQSNLTLQDANFTPDGKLIYGYDADTTLNLWDLQGNLIYTYNGHNAYFTPDGNRLYTIKNHKNKDSELRDYLTPKAPTTISNQTKHSKNPSIIHFMGDGYDY